VAALGGRTKGKSHDGTSFTLKIGALVLSRA
jgi:hypothetical protein